MKVFIILGLALVSLAVTVDAIKCLREVPVGEDVCGPPRNALIMFARRVVHCCASPDLFPKLADGTEDERTETKCKCVTSEELCADRPDRCDGDGNPIPRFVSQ